MKPAELGSPEAFAHELRERLLTKLRELGYVADVGDFYSIEVVHPATGKVLGVELVWVSP